MAYIAVEGPIGVGKTSLSRLLAEALDARLALEVVEENPFLAPFYQDSDGFAFKVQVFFLLSRYRQMQDLHQGALFYPHTVSDYLFEKDFIFGSLNLRGDEWSLYQDLYQQLKPKLTPPDLVVYLRSDPDLLLQRISKRGRPFERDMETHYLRRLGEAYDRHFEHPPYPLYVIEAGNYDFVENPDHRSQLIDEVLERAKVA